MRNVVHFAGWFLAGAVLLLCEALAACLPASRRELRTTTGEDHD